jgi:gliding motility-associated-like protein
MGFSYKIIFLAILFILNCSLGMAQTCTESQGQPTINQTFGAGDPIFGPNVSGTDYTFTNGSPVDGQYTVVHSSEGLNASIWHQNVKNHSPSQIDGYFMAINAGTRQGVFYQWETPVCPNTTYKFSAYVINLLIANGVDPKVKFTIQFDATVIEVGNVDIAKGNATDWVNFSRQFTTGPTTTKVLLKVTNEKLDGNGNDLGLDDITLNTCGPTITPTIENFGQTVALCQANASSYHLTATVTNSSYIDERYQWQYFFIDPESNRPGVWLDITGATEKEWTVDLAGEDGGNYRYRLSVGEAANMASKLCRTISSEVNITLEPTPIPQANDVDACLGKDTQIGVSEFQSYEWYNPKGELFSKEEFPAIKNPTMADAGIYTVRVVSAFGCIGVSQMELRLHPPVDAAINTISENICEGKSVQLIASGGTTYNWVPSTGLNNPTIANPIATPERTTVYGVTISNGACPETKYVTINVTKKAQVSAGRDLKITEGESVQLNGSVIGDGISYYWTPTDYLDDPTKLDPIATPKTNMTYTLHAKTFCEELTDEMTVKVLPKLDFPNSFSPNGDGINDFWSIPSLDLLPNPRLVIVNRYGQLVYDASENIKWDGKRNGKDIPVGTYFFNLYINRNEKIASGWILLMR